MKEKNRRKTKEYLVQRARDMVLYKEAYMQQLIMGAGYIDYKYKVFFCHPCSSLFPASERENASRQIYCASRQNEESQT